MRKKDGLLWSGRRELRRGGLVQAQRVKAMRVAIKLTFHVLVRKARGTIWLDGLLQRSCHMDTNFISAKRGPIASRTQSKAVKTYIIVVQWALPCISILLLYVSKRKLNSKTVKIFSLENFPLHKIRLISGLFSERKHQVPTSRGWGTSYFDRKANSQAVGIQIKP